MTVGELFRAIGKCQIVELIQGDNIYFRGNVDNIPLHYMDAAVKYFTATAYEHPTTETLTYITIVLCE